MHKNLSLRIRNASNCVYAACNTWTVDSHDESWLISLPIKSKTIRCDAHSIPHKRPWTRAARHILLTWPSRLISNNATCAGEVCDILEGRVFEMLAACWQRVRILLLKRRIMKWFHRIGWHRLIIFYCGYLKYI